MLKSVKPRHEGGNFQPIPWRLCGKLSKLETCGTILGFDLEAYLGCLRV